MHTQEGPSTSEKTGHQSDFNESIINKLLGIFEEFLELTEREAKVTELRTETVALKGLMTDVQWSEVLAEAKSRWKDRNEEPNLSQKELEEFYLRNTGGAFPASAHDDAFHGIAGEITETICSFSSVKPEAVLAQLLVCTGIMLGRDLYMPQGHRHRCNLYAVIGGNAGSGKGESLGYVKDFIESVDPYFMARFQSGFKSGEALIDAVGDVAYGVDEEGNEIVVDQDQPKRLIIDEEEFAAFLISGRRQGNVITSNIRKLWDSPETYATQSRGKPRTTTGAHIGLVGNVTPDELQRVIGGDARNGLASRILWIAAKRTRSIPRPRFIEWKGSPALERFQNVLETLAGKAVRYQYTEQGGDYWDNVVFKKLEHASATRGGMLGDILARSIPTVLRLSMIYAALDKSKKINVAHLKAAQALWDYSVASACWIFGNRSGNWRSDAIVTQLRKVSPRGLTRTQIAEQVFSKKGSKSQFDEALSVLVQHKEVVKQIK
jgi:hypothetical protein